MKQHNHKYATAELTLIRAGQHLWAWWKRSCGKNRQVSESEALYAALETVWNCKRELRAEMKAQHKALASQVRSSGRFAATLQPAA